MKGQKLCVKEDIATYLSIGTHWNKPRAYSFKILEVVLSVSSFNFDLTDTFCSGRPVTEKRDIFENVKQDRHMSSYNINEDTYKGIERKTLLTYSKMAGFTKSSISSAKSENLLNIFSNKIRIFYIISYMTFYRVVKCLPQ